MFFLILPIACTAPDADPRAHHPGTAAQARINEDTDTQTDTDAHTDTDPGDTQTDPVDDATIVSATFPDALDCDDAIDAIVTVRNTGTTTWTSADGYKLGAVGDSDPLQTGDGRIYLNDGETVVPGETRTFTVPLAGADSAGTYTTDWQMVHEGVRWFGGQTVHDVAVECARSTEIDLARTVVVYSPPDVASWPVTTTITTLDLNMEGVYIDFDKRDGDGSWPDVPFGAPGDSLEYSLWIVLNIEGQWYTAGCIQYWRGLERNGGPPSGYAENWYYDSNRWRPMTGHQPAVGESVGFFVTAGNARNVTDDSGSIVYERSNIVVVPFPADPGAVFRY